MGLTGTLASPGPPPLTSPAAAAPGAESGGKHADRLLPRNRPTFGALREFEKSKKGADGLTPSPVEACIGWPVIAVGWVIASRRVGAYGPVIAQPRGVVAGIRRRAIAVI